MAASKSRKRVVETQEERAVRLLDRGARLYASRCDTLAKTLRNNAQDVGPYRRRVLAQWLKNHNDRLVALLEDDDGIPPLDLGSIPDLDA